MLLQECVLIHKNVPPETIQLYHLNLNILTHSNISKFKNNEKNKKSCFKKLLYLKKIMATLIIR